MVQKKDFIKVNDFLWELPVSFNLRMKVPARIYASEKMIDDILRDRSVEQLINGTTLPGIVRYGLAMPDCHQGYAVPIGFVGAIRTKDGLISPGACGFDINCGIKLLKSEAEESDIQSSLPALVDNIYRQVPSGLGQSRKLKLALPQLDKILANGLLTLLEQGYAGQKDIEYCESGGRLDWADAAAVSSYAKERGRNQLGTLGSGNHFLEIQKVAEIFDKAAARNFGLFKNQVVIMIHCGSRGLGHQICSDYLKEFIPLMAKKYKINFLDKQFACLPFSSSEGQRYFRAMAAAANYAWANRQMIAYFVRKAWRSILKDNCGDLTSLYDVAHNIIKIEKYNINGREQELAVHRKGATRAFPANHVEIPAAYRPVGQPVLIPGSMGTASYVLRGAKEGESSFYSASHGAGRRMSRQAAMRSISGQKVINQLKSKGIIIKCQKPKNIAEESPLAYKDIDEVVEVIDRAGLSKKVAKLLPLAVIKGE